MKNTIMGQARNIVEQVKRTLAEKTVIVEQVLPENTVLMKDVYSSVDFAERTRRSEELTRKLRLLSDKMHSDAFHGPAGAAVGSFIGSVSPAPLGTGGSGILHGPHDVGSAAAYMEAARQRKSFIDIQLDRQPITLMQALSYGLTTDEIRILEKQNLIKKPEPELQPGEWNMSKLTAVGMFAGSMTTATLNAKEDITPFELYLIWRLFGMARVMGNLIAFIMDNNLQRHFDFETQE